MTRKLSAAGAAATVFLMLSAAQAAQPQDDGKGAGGYEMLSSGNTQGIPAPDVSGIQQQMQAQMMRQMTQQMQSASPAAQIAQGATFPQKMATAAAGQAAQNAVPDVNGIQQQMQAQMMRQMQSASPAAQIIQGAATLLQNTPPTTAAPMPDMTMRQNMQLQLQNVLGINSAAQAPQSTSGGFQIDSAISAIKMDPAVKAAINEKMRKMMEQTMRETFADPKVRQEMQQRFLSNGISPSSGESKSQP